MQTLKNLYKKAQGAVVWAVVQFAKPGFWWGAAFGAGTVIFIVGFGEFVKAVSS